MNRSKKSRKHDNWAEVALCAERAARSRRRAYRTRPPGSNWPAPTFQSSVDFGRNSIRAKLLAPVTEMSAAQLAGQFLVSFLSERRLPEYTSESNLRFQLGAAYLRYSDDGSNPRSLDQQLKNVLERAARDRVFIPWAYVFADAAMSGTTAARRGDPEDQGGRPASQAGGSQCVYVDEIGRASRDAIEALRLGKLIEESRKRMVGGPTDSTRIFRSPR